MGGRNCTHGALFPHFPGQNVAKYRFCHHSAVPGPFRADQKRKRRLDFSQSSPKNELAVENMARAPIKRRLNHE
jgi:hypothetical protein